MHKSKKFLTIISIMAASAGMLTACSNTKQMTGTVATYQANGKQKSITDQSFYKSLKQSPYAKDQLSKLLLNDALLSQFNVSNKKVNNELASIKKQYGQQYQQIMKQQGGEKAFKLFLKAQQALQLAVKKYTSVTQKELNDAWAKYTPNITVQHVLVKDEATAEKIDQKAKNGADFAKLVEKYSIDTGSKQNQGKIVINSSSHVDPAFYKAVKSLKKGQISDVVKSGFGYHVIKCLDKPTSKGTLAEHKQEITDNLLLQKRQDPEIMQKVMKKVFQKADIKIKDKDLKGALDHYLYPQEQPMSPQTQR